MTPIMVWTARLKLLFACWLVGLALALPAQASHSSPPFYIDDDSPPEEDFDGDYHFHSIRAALEQFPHPQEGDALFIAPGVYEGDLLLQGVDHLTLSDNVWVSNGEAGLSLENGRDVHLEREQALHNAGHGMALSDVQRATLDQVTCSENGEAGVQFNDAVDNAISGSRFERNGAAGVKLEGRSQDNAIADSQFRGHSDEAAAGLWLAGQAYDNQVRDNELVENRVGIRFSQAHREAPAG